MICFDEPVKSKQEPYEKLIEMSRNNEYTVGNILDYSYHQKYYKRIGTDLSIIFHYTKSFTSSSVKIFR